MKIVLPACLVLSGCAAGLELGGALAADHIRNTPRTPTITFVNELPAPVCAINMWRDGAPTGDRDANWLELSDLRRLEPGASVTVGILPRDAVYHLQAVDCGGAVLSRVDVTPIPGQPLRLAPASTRPPVAEPGPSPQL